MTSENAGPVSSGTLRRAALYCLLAASHWLLITRAVRAEVDLYPFPKVDDARPVKTKEKRTAEPFVQALSKKFALPEELLAEHLAAGTGRVEIIRLILISKKSGKSLEELVKEREKGARLSKLAESAGLEPKKIRQEAESLFKEIEQESLRIKAETSVSTSTIAGVNNTLSGKSGDAHGSRGRDEAHPK